MVLNGASIMLDPCLHNEPPQLLTFDLVSKFAAESVLSDVQLT